MLKLILLVIAIFTGGSVALGPTKRILRRHRQLKWATIAFAVTSGLLTAIEIIESADSILYWSYHEFGPSKEQIVAAAIKSCDSNLDLGCINDGGAYGAADLPLNFHPAAIRASANVTPFGAVSVPA
jgi:hypothetical protein